MSSSKLSFDSPMALRRCFFTLLTAASHSPPKWGPCSGMKRHSILCEVQKSVIISWWYSCARNLYKSISSRLAPTKFVPWSLHMRVGRPQRPMKRRSVAIKALVVKLQTSSTCTALTVKETKTQAYAFRIVGFCMLPDLIRKGPA